MNNNDIEVYHKMQKSPLLFVRSMWGMTPQPFKSQEMKDLAMKTPLDEWKPEFFGNYDEKTEKWRWAGQPKFMTANTWVRKSKHITWQQYIILLSIERAMKGEAPKKISIASGNGIGKTCTLSFIILWYLFCFMGAQIGCTAASSKQIHDVLWKEIAVWLSKMPDDVKSKYDHKSEYIRMTEEHKTWWARAATARKENPEALSGLHGDNVALMVDEASGVHDAIYETAQSVLTSPNVLFICISNPTRLTGFFYDTHHKTKNRWQNYSFSGVNSPVVNEDFVYEAIEREGKESDYYRVFVEGKFPNEQAVSEEGFIPLFKSSDLTMTEDDFNFNSEGLRLGIDPAGEGQDEALWVIRDRFKAKVVGREKKSTPKGIAQRTISLMKHYNISSEQVFIDCFGEGTDATMELLAAGYHINTVVTKDKNGINKKVYSNLRAKIYWETKNWMRTGGMIIGDEKDWEKEMKNVKYRPTLSGQMQIMSKMKMRKLGIKSPNMLDALTLTFAEDEPNYEFDKLKEKQYIDSMLSNISDLAG